MKTRWLALCVLSVLFVASCNPPEEDPEDELVEYEPEAVQKTQDAKVYVHLMPWFETPSTNNGEWGQHWTMANRDPDIVVDGKHSIASHYYPLIGPYASRDKDVIEYQVLLMKLSGIDGVLIDWYGTIDLYDYPAIKANTEAFISVLEKTGLQYAITYEDQTIRAGLDQGKISDGIIAAKADMAYLQNSFFQSENYIKVDGAPLLLTFGPQYFQSGGDWTDVFAGLATKPKFMTLWYQSGEAGVNAGGEYSWVYQDANSHISHLDNFYDRSIPGLKMGSAYPGFHDYYQQGGWGNNYFLIPHNGTATFSETLSKALGKVDHIQLVTWNDYGEGTMIEPTVEFGYSFLTTLQSSLGVGYAEADLLLVAKYYELKRQFKSDPVIRKQLEQVFYYFVSLQLDKAAEVLDRIEP